MRRLVALDLPGGPDFVTALRRAWDDGDAVFPVDQRLGPTARAELIDRMGCGSIVGPDGGSTRTAGGVDVDDGDALVVATSGSTGDPKGVVLTHAAVAASAEATCERLAVGDDDHWLACLPLNHVGGLSVVTRALHRGTRLTVHPRFDPAAAEASGATLVALVATALGRIDPTRFRTILLGGSRPPTDRPPNTVTTYGMTETGSGVVYDGTPLRGVEVRIVDGEVEVRCAMSLRCYRDGTDPKRPDGWLPTGDIGAIDGNGRLSVQGRRGDLIVTGGENVWPEPVEAVLLGLDGITDAAVVGRPDPEWGQVVVAVVVPDDPDRPVPLERVRSHVKEHLPAWCAPRAVEFRTVLPRTALGKLRRADLVDPAG